MRLMSKIYNLNDPGWGKNGGKNDSEPPRRPAGNRPGSPDLDEVWRDFNNRLGNVFGRGGRGGNGQGGGGGGASLPKGSPKMFVVGLLVLVLLWLASGFLIVQEGQVAVVTRFGKYVKTLTPGLQWRMPYPIEADQVVNIAQLRTFEVGYRGSVRNKVLPESLMLTTDENIVDVQFVVQYRLNPEGAPDYLFKTVHPDESVRQAVDTAMREVVGQQPMDSVLYSGRTEIAARVLRSAQQILDRYKTGIQISTVAIQNVQPPEQVQAAFDDAVKAGQDRERLINEGNAYASRVLPETQGQVARMLQEAEGYRAKVVGDAQGDTARFLSVEGEYVKAPEVTGDRMYLDTMHSVLQRSGKVLLDTAEGNNMLYLPLDKIAGRVAAEAANSSPEAQAERAATGGAKQVQQGGTGTPAPRSSGSGLYGSGASSNGDLTNPYSR
ncbi:FtsH protease activity modulator HflK [Pusillimonas sp. CC-YST705]|uniref:Protein HflK n=1 Tax=Mesopusillimonas faecipullorum TaxID=2755040 RepID=A0ABS8CAA5_9BURK|nr:FtsH protease activity modulator HflK [Mesopusillimonas faecipullorum]MCB5362945.1 FtsH protease activity modulator HflK [Mesopusillimonas faecipullorum]